MPCYKILGIYSYADNLKNVSINDSIILKNECYNIKSKNAIGVYSSDNKKLGYLPSENCNEIKNFNTAYKISKLVLNQEYPILEINRYYPSINFIDNVEYPFEKKIKYVYELINMTNQLKKSVIGLEKYLLTKKIKVKKIAVIYADDNFINILIEVSKGFEQFQTVTIKYFKDNSDKYEELYENDLIDNTFFRDLLVYRLECYIENNYLSINKYIDINSTKYDINEKVIHEELNIKYKKIDIIILTKLYLRYLLNDNDYYLLKYINTIMVNEIDTIMVNEIDNVNNAMQEIIPNYEIFKKFITDYNLEIGKFTYDHKLKIYSYIDFTNIDTVFVISQEFIPKYIYCTYLTNKQNMIVYNPIEGKILVINNINVNI